MKPIKFRAWVVDEYAEDDNTPKTFQIVNWFEEFFSDMSPVTLWSSYFPEEEDPCVVLMQYVCLNDKNGKEIYEEDLVKKDGDSRIYKVIMDWSGARPFHLDSFQSIQTHEVDVSIDFLPISISGKVFARPHPASIAEKWEVIGNTFENPELANKV